MNSVCVIAISRADRWSRSSGGKADTFAIGNCGGSGSDPLARGFGHASDPLAFQLRQHPGQASQRSHGLQFSRQESDNLRRRV